MRRFLTYYYDPIPDGTTIDPFEPLNIVITNDRKLPDTWTDCDYLDLDFSPRVHDFHPFLNLNEGAMSYLVVPHYSRTFDLGDDGPSLGYYQSKQIQLHNQWHIEKVTHSMVDAKEVQLAILEDRWKLGQVLEWDLEGSVLNKVVIYEIPTYYKINV